MFTTKNKASNPDDHVFASSANNNIDVGHAKYPLAFKIPLAAFILTITTAIVIGTTFYIESNNIVIQKRLKDVEDNGQLLSLLINNFYEDLNSDVMFLYGTPPVQAITQSNDEELDVWKTRLKTIFSTMLYSNSIYTKIQFIGIDDDGREIVRVDRHGYKVVDTPDAGMQQKGHGVFFKTAITYEKGSVYFSDIVLNRELGKISIPHTPILKSAIPVYNDDTGKVFGVIVISANYSKVAPKLLSAVPADTLLYLANKDGYFLVHPNKTKEFGFDTGKSFKLQGEFPFLSKVIADEIPALVIPSFDNELLDQDVGNYSLVSFENVENRHPLRLLLISDDKTYLQSIAGVRYRSFLLALALSIAALVFAFIASRRFTNPLMQMIKSVQQYEKTGHVMDLPVDSKDEIGVLARAFYNTLEIAKDRENDAKSANARIVAILESAADAIITISAYGEILSFNDAAEKTFGYSEKEAIGRNIKFLMPSPHHDEHDNYLANYMETGQAKIIGLSRDVQAVRKCGEVFPIELSISEIKTESENLFTGMVRDVSERKSAEETLVKYAQELEGKSLELELLTQKADAANSARGDFLANMSHEIRTPMNGIIGTCSLMMETDLTKKQSEYLNTVTKSSEELLHIINDILDFSKIEAGKLDFDNLPFDLAALMNETNDVMSVNTNSGVEMTLFYPNDLPRYVYGDPGRVKQILFNLISNASKFTSKGYIEVRVEKVIQNDDKHEFTISVKDSGIGVSKDKLDHIFKKFGQAEDTTTRKFGGTGLGLSICSELVHMMGGDMLVDSVIGKGSKFTFSMCLGASTKEAVEEVEHQDCMADVGNVGFNGASILLADDNSTNMIIVTEMLEQYGCRVTPAVNGNEVVEIEAKSKFDLIFMDCMMPEMDGYDATGLIRKREKLEGIPPATIVALTANAMKGDREKCIDAGMDDYITKPIKKELLAKILLKHLSNKEVNE